MQSELIPKVVRGKEFGLVQALFNFGSVLGPIIGGAIYDQFLGSTFNLIGVEYLGAGITFVLAGILGIIGSITFLLFVSSDHQETQKKSNFVTETSTKEK
jgi:MFS family permease